MASKDSIRFLAGSIGSIGDRLIQDKLQNQAQQNADRNFGLQEKYQKMSEAKFGEEKIQARKNEANFKFQELAKVEAAKILQAAGKEVNENTMAAVMPEAAKRVYRNSMSGSAGMLGPEYRSAYGTDPSRQNLQIPNALVPPSAMGPSQMSIGGRRTVAPLYPGYKPPSAQEQMLINQEREKKQREMEFYGGFNQ